MNEGDDSKRDRQNRRHRRPQELAGAVTGVAKMRFLKALKLADGANVDWRRLPGTGPFSTISRQYLLIDSFTLFP